MIVQIIEAFKDRLELAGRFFGFSLECLVGSFVSLAQRPGAVFVQFERVALGSCALVAAAGASIGAVTWLQLHRLLVTYGIEATLPSVLAVAVLVETGPMLASLLVAGRLGAGLAAELGSMKLTEELDALSLLGAPVVPTLVAPRVIACTLAVPFLTVLIDTTAIAGGFLAESLAGTLSWQVFWTRSFEYIQLSVVVPATLKTAVFGALIGVVGCWTGLMAERSTEAVGRAATRGVVRSMLAVFVANVLMVPLIQLVTKLIGWE
jgi:phospholipid/cholesterol/gamma-HCH transport system permease protein